MTEWSCEKDDENCSDCRHRSEGRESVSMIDVQAMSREDERAEVRAERSTDDLVDQSTSTDDEA